jgi:hypothetical protein
VGYFEADRSDDYVFRLYHDDGCRFWMKGAGDLPPEDDDPATVGSWWHASWGAPDSESWTGNDWGIRTVTKRLEAGRLYPFKVEWGQSPMWPNMVLERLL